MATGKPAKGAASALSAADARTAQAMAKVDEGPILARLSDLGDQPQLRLLCAALIAGGLVAKRPHLALTGLRMLAAHQLATMAKDFVKRRIDRTRPRSLSGPGKDHRPRPGGKRHKEETSFPSGHAAGAAAAARAFARAYPRHGASAAIAGGTLALVQLPRSAHYPSDVAAGLAIGLAAEAAVAAVWPARAPQSPERETSSCAASH